MKTLKSIAAFLLLSGLTVPVQSHARNSDSKDVTVKVTVLDEAGHAVPTAVIRHPDEEVRHPVNIADGSWSESVLYLPDGQNLIFEQGMELEFEVSAPNHVTRHIIYVIEKKKNHLEVTLEKMDYSFDWELEDEPVIQFGRDRPLDGTPIESSGN